MLKINLAKIKTTYGSPLGLCLKNTKGIIPDDYKLHFHLLGVQKALVDLAKVVTWDISILEGFPMSELGISAGTGPFGLSTNPIVLDSIFCRILKIPVEKVEHINALEKYIEMDLQELDNSIILQSIINASSGVKYTKSGIESLQNEYNVKIEDSGACSACVESMAKVLERLKNDNLIPDKGKLFIGAKACTGRDSISNNSTAILIGNCSFDKLGMRLVESGYSAQIIQEWESSKKIPGCPPTIDEMARIIPTDSSNKLDQMEIRSSKRIKESFDINEMQSILDSGSYARILEVIPNEKIDYCSFDKEKAIACELISAAICHQINWEFLRDRIYSSVKSGSEWWKPANLSKVTTKTIERLLTGYKKSYRIRAKERSRMVRSLSNIFVGKINNYSQIFGSVNGLIDEKESNNVKREVIGVLKMADVFSEDPTEKKIQVLFHNLSRSGLVKGIELFCEPAIDYHIMRVFLRRGDVYPKTKEGIDFLSQDVTRQAKTVNALRSIVSDALTIASKTSNMPIAAVNNIEWWIGRLICHRVKPDCELKNVSAEWINSSFSKCPFSDSCLAYNSNKFLLNRKEPVYHGKLY